MANFKPINNFYFVSPSLCGSFIWPQYVTSGYYNSASLPLHSLPDDSSNSVSDHYNSEEQNDKPSLYSSHN